MTMVSKQILIVFWLDSYWRFIKGLSEGESRNSASMEPTVLGLSKKESTAHGPHP